MGWLMLLSIAAASLNSCVMNISRVRKKDEVFFFNFIGAVVWLCILLAVNGGLPKINSAVLVWGMVYGFIQAMFIFFKTEAMSNGSVAVTTLLGNSSLLISVAVSLFVWKETVGIWDVLGLALLCMAVFFCVYKKSNQAYTSAWKYFAVFFLIFAAAVGLVFKAFGKSSAAGFSGDMMLISAGFMTLFYAAACLMCGGFKPKRDAKGGYKFFFAAAVASGMLSCLYNRLNIFLSAELDAIIFFPFFNGGVVLLSTLIGVYICKEHLSKMQIWGIILGIISICVIGIL